ncbi:MAG TPA: M12 family metallo-peptidase, partial [Candidatus Saccharimonadia bacterium]|nr:M12 family metallo-peptidase [Candidatus Saccharimonadia bacterium]
PDGSKGINLIQDYGQSGAATGGNAVAGFSAMLPGTFDATHAAIKAANFDPKRLGYFHYVLMAHRYNLTSSSSGYAETIGDDVLVTLQCVRNPAVVGNTIAHELGHNLGLKHGGDEGCNRKPNYNSIMNYTFQFSGVATSCTGAPDGGRAAFSDGKRPSLDERTLDEEGSVCGTKSFDWNGDGLIQAGLAHDLNPQHAGICGGALTVLTDFDDWSNLTYAGLLDKHGLLKNVQSEIECPPVPVISAKAATAAAPAA